MIDSKTRESIVRKFSIMVGEGIHNDSRIQVFADLTERLFKLSKADMDRIMADALEMGVTQLRSIADEKDKKAAASVQPMNDLFIPDDCAHCPDESCPSRRAPYVSENN